MLLLLCSGDVEANPGPVSMQDTCVQFVVGVRQQGIECSS